MRCLALAAHLRRRGAHVTFALRYPPRSVTERISAAGHDVVALEVDVPGADLQSRPWPESVQDQDVAATLAALDGGADAVVVDHYGLDVRWESRVRAGTPHVVGIDDLADRERDLDVLVDQNWYGEGTASRHQGRVPSGCLLLLGPRYALLQPEYAEVRGHRVPVRHPPRRVLVSFGGADVTGETRRVLAALGGDHDLSSLEVDVVMGSRNLVTPELRAQVDARPHTWLHVDVPSLAPLLGSADLAVGASGAATWERICLGVPAIVTTTRRSQSGVTEALATAGLTTWAGVGGDLTIEDHRRLLHDALASPPPVPPPLVDGLGAGRVAEAVLPSDGASVSVTPATAMDAPVHIGDDPGVAPRRRDRHVLLGPAVWHEEAAWFERDLADPTAWRGVIRLDGLSIGRVRGRCDGDEVEVTWALDDLAAGQEMALRVHHALTDARWTLDEGRLGFRPEVGHPARIGGRPPALDPQDLDGRLVVPLTASRN